MASKPTPLLIVGTGALACLFAARCTNAGKKIAMLGNWPEGVQTLRDQGVCLQEMDGSEKNFPVEVIHTFEKKARFSYALVLVKSWQTERAARQVAEYLTCDGIVLTLQNGLGNREILAQVLGEERVFLGTATTGATLLAPGRVRAGGEGMISLSRGSEMSIFKQWFQQAGFAVQAVADLDGLVWGKLVVNAAINPLTALLGVPNGALLHLETARVLMAGVAREVAAVAKAQGIQLPFLDPITAAEEVARKTAANHSSMLQDIQRGALTEIEAICGAVVATGNKAGVPAPLNETLYRLVKALAEKKSR
jgi:2-dehydropantoate 2-reductase